MIKRYIITTAYKYSSTKRVVADGFDLFEESYKDGVLVDLKLVSHFHFKELAQLNKLKLESEAKKSKQWLELLPPLMQYDALTEEEMVKDYV